jgi:succinoglycan biosynthesis transport protein ExoP
MMDRVFRTPPQIEKLLHVSCLASIPTVETNLGFSAQRTKAEAASVNVFWPFGRRKNLPSGHAGGRSTLTLPSERTELAVNHRELHGDRRLSATVGVARTVIDSPFSRFAEGMRAINLAADLSNFGTATNVIGITSALPNEGKSTISEAMAQVVAQSGSRTILVDGDLRNPSLTARLAPDAKHGLVDVVLGTSHLNEVIWVDPQTKLHFLPCVVTSRFSNSADVLASAQMEKLFKLLREHYDRIILDLSPLAPVIDVRATGAFVDCYVLVIEWGKAKTDVVTRVLNEAPAVHERLLGAVLNKVNIAVMNRYDSYHGEYYHSQYYKRYGYVD